MNYIQQTDEAFRNEIETLTTAAESGSWDRRAACYLKIQAMVSELDRHKQDKLGRVHTNRSASTMSANERNIQLIVK
jgi:hypothetical protein